MASTKPKGTVYLGPIGQIAIRMGDKVTAGDYLVVDPDAGGYYAGMDDEIARIETWTALETPAEPAQQEAPASPAPAP